MSFKDPWISTKERMPVEGQEVFYFFEFVGVNRGKYSDYHCFYGKRGFLTGDVTYWFPDDGREEMPLPPIDFNTVPFYKTFNDFLRSVEIDWGKGKDSKFFLRNKSSLKERFEHLKQREGSGKAIAILYERKVDDKGIETYALFDREGNGLCP